MKGTQLHLFTNEESNKLSSQRRALVLPIDTLVLLSVVMLLLLTLSFSLGVEKGRRNAAKAFDKERQILLAAKDTTESAQAQIESLMTDTAQLPQVSSPKPISVPVQPVSVVSRPVQSISQTASEALPVARVREEPAVLPADAKSASGKKFIIQVASYATKEPAQAELKKIAKYGFPVFIAQKGKFLAILVGEFKDEKTAKAALDSLKKQYKDCILKKI